MSHGARLAGRWRSDADRKRRSRLQDRGWPWRSFALLRSDREQRLLALFFGRRLQAPRAAGLGQLALEPLFFGDARLGEAGKQAEGDRRQEQRRNGRKPEA